MGHGTWWNPVEPNRPMLVHEHPQKAHITRASLQTAASGLGVSSLAPILPWRTGLCPTASPALECWGALCRHYGAPQIDWGTWWGEKVGTGSRDRRARDPSPPSRACATGPSLPTILQWTLQMQEQTPHPPPMGLPHPLHLHK